MKPFIFFIFIFFSFLPALSQTRTAGGITAQTGTSTLLDGGGGLSFAMTEQKFIETSRRISASNPNFVGIKRKPAKLTGAALFGFNLVFQLKNTSWILDRNEKKDYVLYVDFNADGDLTNDKPLAFRQTGGKHFAEVHRMETETYDNQLRKYAHDMRLEVAEELSRDRTEKQIVLKIQDDTLRRGVLNLKDRQIAFALIGSRGTYDYDYHRLWFDLDGDDKFDLETPYSPEIYKVNEKYLNIGETTFEFKVDRYGGSLTLEPLGKKLPERADLRVGSTAPDFSFVDINGNRRRLSEFRGKIVLLDVWALWCAPCVREAPQLAAAYQKLKEKNFEIISLNKNDPPEHLRKFIAENRMNWTHTTTDAAFLGLYRVDQFPTYFLLDKNGVIISNTLRAGEEMYKKVDELGSL